jgi:DNA-3-methyladenine glycosylase I
VAEPTRRPGVIREADGVPRCWWCAGDELYRAYHDGEWGRPVTDDARLFERLCLEGFQAGLAWITILRKREAFRRAFAGFDPARVARFGARERARLLADAGIVRHAGKIDAAIGNARATLALAAERGSLAAHLWSFAPGRERRRVTRASIPGETAESRALARDLKRRGFRFVGPTTAYALMQAVGMVDDHVTGCAVRDAVEVERSRCALRPGR